MRRIDFEGFIGLSGQKKEELVRRAAEKTTLMEVIGKLIELNPSDQRYEFEYANDVYASYKPGIDDGYLLGLLDPVPTQVLEFGSGTGDFLEMLRRRKTPGVGIEPAVAGVKQMIQKGLEAYRGNILELQDYGIKPDCVVLAYFLDRCGDPRLALENAKRLSNRWLIVTVWLPLTYRDAHGTVYCPEEKRIGRGAEAQEDRVALIESVIDGEWSCWGSGLTRHWGVCSEGFEDLDCYVLVFEKK